MPKHRLPRFRLADIPIVFSPSFEHYGDLKGPGDLHLDFWNEGSLCEEDRDAALALCRRAEGSFTSIGAAKAALNVARRQMEAA